VLPVEHPQLRPSQTRMRGHIRASGAMKRRYLSAVRLPYIRRQAGHDENSLAQLQTETIRRMD
jgi:hypothetical protein